MSQVGVANGSQKASNTLVERIKCQNGQDKLDLSLCQLTRVPLQAIHDNYNGVPIHLDLAFNKISFISPKFTLDMINLQRLDLSRNCIKKLPDNFGAMEQLVYLDLHKNELTTLPVTMGKMQRLSFLHISNNPFRGPLRDFLGATLSPGISPVALAQLVVQFLDEFSTVHNADNSRPAEVSTSCESKHSAKVHYCSRSMRRVSESGSSISSLDSNNNALSPKHSLGSPKVSRSGPVGHPGVDYTLLKNIGKVILWFVMIPVMFAYIAETSYLEHKVKSYPSLGSAWRMYKPLHAFLEQIVKLIGGQGYLQGPQPVTVTEAVIGKAWGFYEFGKQVVWYTWRVARGMLCPMMQILQIVNALLQLIRSA